MQAFVVFALSLVLSSSAWAAGSGFLFGVSNAAFQVEGSPADSDWYRWTHTPGKISDGTNADISTDFWHRYEEDFKLAHDQGLNTFRLSIAWERVEPSPGQFDKAALDHYVTMITKLRAYGLEPVVTLVHYVLPQWVAEKGGLEWSGFPQAFALYAGHVVDRLAKDPGTHVTYFMTINEPTIQVRFGYLDARKFPPGVDNVDRATRALANLAVAHIEAYRAVSKLKLPAVKMSVAHNWQVFDPASRKPQDVAMAKKVNWMFNEAFVQALQTGKIVFDMPGVTRKINETVALPDGKPTLDYLAIQNYGRSFVAASDSYPFYTLADSSDPKRLQNDLGWEIVPDALYRSVTQAYEISGHLPMMISETGVADHQANDAIRQRYLQLNFDTVRRLQKEAKLFAYIHWSLTDNFEWAFGQGPRFGLVNINYAKNLAREPRPSLATYRNLVTKFRQEQH